MDFADQLHHIGPKTNSAEKINMLRKAGLNVVRMNFSHGTYEYHQSVIDNAREAESKQPGRPLAIALDTVWEWYNTQLSMVALIPAIERP